MFKNDPVHIAQTLTHMDAIARRQTNFDQSAAKEVMKQFMARDRRFDGYDHQRVVDRVFEAKQSGAVFDVDDPYLRKGGQKRPLSW
jgi:hypothetical protein